MACIGIEGMLCDRHVVFGCVNDHVVYCLMLLSSNATSWEDAHATSGSLAVTVVYQPVEQVSFCVEGEKEGGREREGGRSEEG